MKICYLKHEFLFLRADLFERGIQESMERMTEKCGVDDRHMKAMCKISNYIFGYKWWISIFNKLSEQIISTQTMLLRDYIIFNTQLKHKFWKHCNS